MNHFTIIVTAYNCETWIEKCLGSALDQDYPNFDILVLDAQSTDGTWEAISRFKGLTKTVRNSERKYQVENVRFLTQLAREGSIIVSLDGDDWLKNHKVLSILNEVYTPDVWMTYGTYDQTDGRDVAELYWQYPDEVIARGSYRTHERWLSSHLRTWRRELFLSIKEEDLKIGAEYPKMAGDMFFMYPMLEMAAERQRYIPDILYTYNVHNPISDGKVNLKLQEDTADWIKSQPPYKRLEILA